MPTGIYNRKIKPIQERFEDRFIPEPMSGCHLWIGEILKGGYGRMHIHLKTKIIASRLSWELYYGPIPNGLHVLHKCDTPSCVNPHHLFLGTKNDNNKDSGQKGRKPWGEKHPKAKLTSKQVFEIRKDTRPGEIISKEYKVTSRTINHIRNRETWKHLNVHSN